MARVTFLQRVERALKGMLPRRKNWRMWTSPAWRPATFDRMAREGYRLNAAVNICITKYAQAYQMAPWRALDAAGELLDADAPLARLLARPNALMGQAELRLFIGVYKAIGGQCYLHKVRDDSGQVIELWPYHVGQMWPVAGESTWIDHYDYDAGDGKAQRIEAEDIIHLKWPSIDPLSPWLALAPLTSMAREVDTDSEATRYAYALLFNDATPLTVVNVKTSMKPLQFERLQAQFEQRHGGENRGRVAIVEGDASITRMGLNLQELAMDALRSVPEARIANGFGMSAMYAGLSAGMERAIYNNVSEARRAFFEDTVVPHAALDDGELTQDLGEELDGSVTRDWSQVVALQENADAVYTRALKVWTGGLATRNEARRMIGLVSVEDLVLAPGAPALPSGDAFTDALEAPAEPTQVIDVTPPKALTDRKLIAKALRAKTTTAAERRIERAVRDYLIGEYTRAADAVAALADE